MRQIWEDTEGAVTVLICTMGVCFKFHLIASSLIETLPN